MCSSYNMAPIYFLRLSKVWSILHHGSVWHVHKKMFLNAFIYFSDIFLLFFHHKICVFVIFISFFDKVSNFRNSILTNQKRELVVFSWWFLYVGKVLKRTLIFFLTIVNAIEMDLSSLY